MIYRHGWYTSPRFVTFSHDGELVIAAGRRDDPINHQNGIVAFYDAVSGRTVRELPQQEIQRAALAADGRMLVVASSREGGFRGKRFVGVEAATGRTRWFNPPENQKDGFVGVAGMRFEANSPWLHVALEDGTVIRFNGLTGHEQRRFVAEWRTPEQQKAGRIRVPHMPNAAFSHDGRTLVSTQIGRIYVWDVESATLRRTIHYPHHWACALTLAADGRTLATADGSSGTPVDDLIRLYDVETGEQFLTLEPGGDRGNVLTFSPDGTKLFTGFYRGTAIVWDVRGGASA